MIPYVEIIDRYTLKKLTNVEPQECWFELGFYELGEFEIFCNATPKNLAALKKGRFVKIPNKRFIWVITSIKYTFNAEGARMISATGYDARYLLKLRCILTPKELNGTITSAVYGLVNHNLGTGAQAVRKINNFTVDTNEILIDISGTQAARGNLLDFVLNLLKLYNCGSIVTYDAGILKFKVFTGGVKTSSVKFSQSLDNLISSEYLTDDDEVATNVMVVSTVEDVEYTKTHDTGKTGIDRAEIILDSKLATKYEDANGEEKELDLTKATDLTLYQSWQKAEGETELANHRTLEEVKGDLDLTGSNYDFDKDYFIGDIVRVQDEYFNYYFNTRITKYTFKQAKTYGEEAEYGE